MTTAHHALQEQQSRRDSNLQFRCCLHTSRPDYLVAGQIAQLANRLEPKYADR